MQAEKQGTRPSAMHSALQVLNSDESMLAAKRAAAGVPEAMARNHSYTHDLDISANAGARAGHGVGLDEDDDEAQGGASSDGDDDSDSDDDSVSSIARGFIESSASSACHHAKNM